MYKVKLLFISAAISALFISCGTTGFQKKHLDAQSIAPGMKTALVIDTEFFSLHNKYPNPYNFKCEDLGQKEKCRKVTAWLNKAAYHRKELMQYLARIIRLQLTGDELPYLNIDKKKHFDSRKFQVKYGKDSQNYCGTARDFTSLRKEGYSHVLFAGFPNCFNVEGGYRGRYYPGLSFGITTYLYDIRQQSGDDSKLENRYNRQKWCYYIVPSQKRKTRTVSYTQRVDLIYSSTTYTTPHTVYILRYCLRVLMVKKGKGNESTNLSLKDIFAGAYPLYLKVYKRAASVNLKLAREHLSGKNISKKREKKFEEVHDLLSDKDAQ